MWRSDDYGVAVVAVVFCSDDEVDCRYFDAVAGGFEFDDS